MRSFLPGLLYELRRRSELLLRRLNQLSAGDKQLAQYLNASLKQLEADRTKLDTALDELDQAFSAGPAQAGLAFAQHSAMRRYKRWNEAATAIEAFLPFAERFTDPEHRRLTELCRALLRNIGGPLQATPPLVGAFSSQHYWVLPESNVICIPALEAHTLLGMPDLCHELGHLIVDREKRRFLHNFGDEVEDHVNRSLVDQLISTQADPDQLLFPLALTGASTITESRPWEEPSWDHSGPRLRSDTGLNLGTDEDRRTAERSIPEGQFKQLRKLWTEAWAYEFVSDMIATYVVGPAYAFQHIRLASGRERSKTYTPQLGELYSGTKHPSEEARFRGMVEILLMASDPEVDRLRELWADYTGSVRDTQPLHYAICYPASLIKSLADRTAKGCEELGMRRYDMASHGDDGDIPGLWIEAWRRFRENPRAYAEWETVTLKRLWAKIDLDSGRIVGDGFGG